MRSRSRSPAPTAFDLACRWLGRAPRSQAEIEAKLRHLGFSERAVDKAVRRLCELHYLDDEELARARTRNLVERGYGDLWIERDLERRGLRDAVVARALATVEAESERARGWVDRRFGGRKSTAAWQALLRRGFCMETVETVLGDVEDGDADDSFAAD